jgi:hypothetical protein
MTKMDVFGIAYQPFCCETTMRGIWFNHVQAILFFDTFQRSRWIVHTRDIAALLYRVENHNVPNSTSGADGDIKHECDHCIRRSLEREYRYLARTIGVEDARDAIVIATARVRGSSRGAMRPIVAKAIVLLSKADANAEFLALCVLALIFFAILTILGVVRWMKPTLETMSIKEWDYSIVYTVIFILVIVCCSRRS